jgi:hypothetical protein
MQVLGNKHEMFRQTLNDIVVSSVAHPAKNEIITIIHSNKKQKWKKST